MPHELRGFANQSHETFTLLMIGLAVSAVGLLAAVLFFNWRHRRTKPPSSASTRAAKAPRKRRKRR